MTRHLLLCALWMALGAQAIAQSQPATPPPEPKPETEAKTQPTPPEEELPGLDDLLDLSEGDAPDSTAADALKRELEDKLAGEQIAEQFQEAVRLMGQTAERLQTGRDTGLTTQRLQDDILKKLDGLIDAAKKQQSSSSSSSSRSESDGQRNQPNQPQSTQSQAGSGENRSEVDPPARRDGAVNPEVDQTGAAWGSLPAHVREALNQGFSDSYSALYRAMTEAYYRRLAEEANK
jgi:hypothetical protein